MKKLNHVALCVFNLILALSATLLPLKSTNVFADDAGSSTDSPPGAGSSSLDRDSTSSTSIPTCKDGYEYVESVGKCYKKCQDGWERNSETNRCRKIRTETTADSSSTSPGTSSSSGASTGSSGSSVVSSSGSSVPGSAGFSSSSASSNSTSSSPASSSSGSGSSSTGTAASVPTCKDGYEYIASINKCYKKCQDGWERNPETNRCRKMTVESEYELESSEDAEPNASSGATSSSGSSAKSSSKSTSCKDGYEYVESTGKCYKKCNEGQIRNPDTNRCKKATIKTEIESEASAAEGGTCKEGYEYVQSAGKCYKKCQDGYERNPDTNRCRKVKDNTGADYGIDVPTTGDGGGTAFVAGGIIAALLAAGAVFIAFQYRLEIKEFIKNRFKKSEKST